MDINLQSLKTSLTPKRVIWAIVILLILALLVTIGRIGMTTAQLLNDVDAAKTILADPVSNAGELPPLVEKSTADLTKLESQLSPFYGLMRGLNWLPRIGGDVAAVPELLPLGVALANAGNAAIVPLSPVLDALADGTPTADLPALAADAIAPNTDAFAHAADFVDIATARRAEIDSETLSPRLAKLVNRLDSGLPLLKMGLELAPVTPELLGINSPQTYMLLAQNNDEMRATGGFISAVGLLTLDGGKITDLKIEDSYAVDDFSHEYPPAPEPLKRIMSAYYWVFRDGNWSPDFPTAAQDLLRLYHISRDGKIAGVIAVDQMALQEIVSAIEPVQVPGFDEPATGANVIEQIRQSWSPNDPNFKGWDADWYKNRKNFMGDLVSALRTRVEKNPATVNWPVLLDATQAAFTGRHIQLWVDDDTAEMAIQRIKWGGGAPASTDGDYIFPVESNVGFNKMSAVVETDFEYQVNLSSLENIVASFTLTQTNPVAPNGACNSKPHYGKDYWDMMKRCYWNYWRLYVPEGSTLISGTPHAVAGENILTGVPFPAEFAPLTDVSGVSGWGTLVFVPRGETVATRVEYRLPSSVVVTDGDSRQYRLTVQKQAGSVDVSGRVTVVLPPHVTLISANPQPDSIVGNTLTFPISLTADHTIMVKFQ